jgi:gliding motility-associated-like protein
VSNAKAVYTITPSNSGCAGNNFKLTVNVYATPTLSINALKSVCQNQVDTFYLNLLGNAPWNLTYLDNVTGLPTTLKNVTNPTQKIIQYNLPDTTVYNFKLINIQDANCYNDTSTVSFAQQILPLPHDSIYTPAGNQICINQSLPLSVNNTKATLYQWFFKDSLIVQTNTNTIQASLPGVYFAATKNTFGCINKTVNTVTMKQLFNNPTIDFTNDVACNLLPIRFSNQTDTLSTGHLNWVWQFSDTDSLNGYNATYTYKTGGTKHIKLIAKSTICNYNVIKDTSLLIRIPETGMMLPPATTYMNTNFRLHSRNLIGDTYKYKWEPSWGLDSTNIASPNFNFNLNQVYKISYISAHGCITTDTIPVYVFENTVVDLFVPKSFSPNGDGVNDQLFVYLAGIKNFHYLKIYNKFGQLIFENKSSDIPWDGTSNGTVQPLGAYAWIAEGEDVNGKIQTKTGSVMLLR